MIVAKLSALLLFVLLIAARREFDAESVSKSDEVAPGMTIAPAILANQLPDFARSFLHS